MKKLRWLIVIGVAAIFLLIATSLLSTANKSNQPSAVATKPEVGFQAPDFTLQTLDGKTVKLSDLRGKPVYLNFWASWCPPCKEEIPDIEAFYEQNKDNVVVLGVNITFNDKIADVQNLLQADHVTYPILLDNPAPGQNAVADNYQVDGIPASFFIDKNGIIRDHVVGAMTLPMLQQSIGKAMQSN